MNSDNNSKSLNEKYDDEDDDGFILVKSKRKKNYSANNKIIINKSSSSNLQQIDEDVVVVVDKEYMFNLNKKILEYKQKLRDYDTCFYWSKMQISLRKLLNEYFSNNINDHNNINLICYGLGSIDNNLCSRYQLALFLLIIDEINKFSIMNCSNEKINNNETKLNINLVEFYDPVFNQNDKILLTDYFHFKLATKNEKCFKSIEKNALNLFYMPHCGKAMYNNLLYSNWSKRSLTHLIILGNSFSTITTNNLDNKLNKYYSYIKDSLSVINEIRLSNECDLTNAFTDFSWHTFETSLLNDQNVLNKLVNKLDESSNQTPIYEPDSEELF